MKLPSIQRKVLSIDFGSKEIKVVEGKYTKNNIQIFKAITIPVEPHFYKDGEILNKDVLSNTIKNSLKENKVSTDLAYGVINSSNIITREINIPKVPDKDIDPLLGYQLSDYLPVDPEDYVVNNILLGTKTENQIEKLNILLVAIPKTMVIDHLELIKASGLKPQVLDYQGNAMAKLLKFNGQVNDFYNTRDLIAASIDIGYNSSKLTIINKGNIEVARVIDIGAKALYENISSFFDYSLEEIKEKIIDIRDISIAREEFTDYYRLLNIVRTTITSLCERIETVFRYYLTRETGNSINFILLQGGLSNIQGMDNLFSNYFNIPSVKLDNLDKIKWSGDLSRFSNAIGGLIRINEVQR